MNEFGTLVQADRLLGVSRPERTAIGVRSIVAYAEGIDVDLVFLRGHNATMDYWSVELRAERGIRVGFSSSPDVPATMASVFTGAVNDDDLCFAAGNLGGGSAGDATGGSSLYGGRVRTWPFPKTDTLVIWWSWATGGIEPGSAVFALPDMGSRGSIWD